MRTQACLLMMLWCIAIAAPVAASESSSAENAQPQQTQKEQKYKKKEKQQDDSLLGSVSKTLSNAVGMLSLENKEGEEGVPRKIAVLPAIPTGDPVEDRELDDIRTAIHNNLSSKNFDLLKPFDIDRMLAQFEQAEGKEHRDYDPQDLADKLGVEGLIYVDVPLVEQVYAAAYAHYKITVRVSFYSKLDNNYIWEKEESIAEREGGISLNPLSFIAQAISSAQVLTEAVRQTLVDKLARIFAAEIPFPIGTRGKIKPVRIDLAISNVAEGPFRAGDEISVFMRAEPGLAATFDIGNEFKGFTMTEQGEGEYVGRYVVNDEDSARGSTVRINAQRIDDNTSIVWRVPGRIKIDTKPPEAISGLETVPVKEAIKLTWDAQTSSYETLTYHIQRADPDTGIYQEIAAINIQEYVDEDIIEGTKYHYRLYAQDEAKNQSPFSSIEVAAVGVGPTDVIEDMIGDSEFYAVASPYIISSHIRVLRNATLSLSPGTIIEFEGEGKLEILGQLRSIGTEKAPITFSGDQMQLVFSNTGTNQSQFNYTRFNGGTIELDQSSALFSHSQFKNMQNALVVSNNSQLTLNNSELSQNQVGLKVDDGQLSLAQVKFVGNKLGWQISGRQTLEAKTLSFEDNQIHIETNKPLALTHATFSEQDYEQLLTRFNGEVSVDFSTVGEKYNLLNTWLKDRWVELLGSANSELWQETYDSLQVIRGHTTNDRIEDFNQTLKYVIGEQLDNTSDFILAVQRFHAVNSSGDNKAKGKLWVQEFKMPYSKNTEKSDGYITKQAQKKLTRDYLKQSYPTLRPAELRKYRRKVKVEKNTVDSQVVYTMKKGLFLHVWVAHYLDMAKIDRSLTLAGLIKKQNSELTVGLISETEDFAFEEMLVTSLKKQGIRYISLGTGTYGKPIQKRAKEMGANIVLETAVKVEETKSGISSNLKMADVSLVLDVYDVHDNQLLEHLTATDNKAGFKTRDIVKKGVAESFGRLESQLLSALWSADDVVTEHKKEQVRLAKIEAKKKAEAERKAKIKAEKARKEKARKEKERKERLLAEQKAKEEEQKRLAKLAKIKAEKEKAAKEKAAKKKAAQELAAKQAAEQSKTDEPPTTEDDSDSKSESDNDT